MLLECLCYSVRGGVAHADAIRDVEAGPLPCILNQTDHRAGLTFGDQLGAEQRIQHDQHTTVCRGGKTRRRLERQRHLVRFEQPIFDLDAAVDDRKTTFLQCGADARIVLAVLRPEDFRIGFGALADRFGQLLGVFDALDVQLVPNQGASPGRQFAESRATGDAHGGQRLLRAHACPLARGVAEPGDDAGQLHDPFELGVAQRLVDLGIGDVVDARRRRWVGRADQVRIQLLGKERQERGHERGQADQRIVQRGHRRGVGVPAWRPESLAAAADVPVAEIVEEGFDRA